MGIDENAQFRIEEVLLLKHPTPIDIVQEVVQFDENNFAFVMMKNGVRIASMDHFMRSTNGGKDTEFRTRMRIGRPGNAFLKNLKDADFVTVEDLCSRAVNVN